MRLHYVFLLVLSFALSACHTHKFIPDFTQLKSVNGTYSSSEYTLVLYAAIGCGYSQRAIQRLQHFEGCKDFQLIVIEKDSTEMIKLHQNTYFAKTIFYSNEDGNLKFKNFFPQYFLYQNGELIWREKGYVAEAETKLNSEMNCGE